MPTLVATSPRDFLGGFFFAFAKKVLKYPNVCINTYLPNYDSNLLKINLSTLTVYEKCQKMSAILTSNVFSRYEKTAKQILILHKKTWLSLFKLCKTCLL